MGSLLGGLVLPGYAFSTCGRPTHARVIYGSYFLAATIFIVWLGNLISSAALALMISLHVGSVLYLMGHRTSQMSFRWRLVLALAVAFIVYRAIYFPFQLQFEKYVAMPLKLANGTLIVDPRHAAGAVRRGDRLAYRIHAASDAHVFINDGYGFGEVRAVAGDRIVFTQHNYQVNGVEFPRQPRMPALETWVVPEKHWFIWPNSAIAVSGNQQQEDSVARLMREVAMVSESQYAGKPYRRWFWRRQPTP